MLFPILSCSSCLVSLQLAPAYEGLELGVGETILVKAIAEVTGRSAKSVKAEIAKKGDLGIVAEVGWIQSHRLNCLD